MSAVLKELETIIRHLPPSKLEQSLDYARELAEEEITPEEIAEFEAGKTEIDRGEWVDWDELYIVDLESRTID
ncbi:MAG: hypothetical protein ACPL5F_07535 [Moorellaceae bacterium]